MNPYCKAPMTAEEAREIVAEMNKATAKAVRIYMYKTAMKIGNLSDAAKAVYLTALKSDITGP